MLGSQAFDDAGIAQPVEHFTRNEGVVSSNLISSFPIRVNISRRGSVW